ncbi:MAG: hypothetical protein B7Z15_10340 [Rhizobiales bacterium 32-66-8]|nr:MAG: hypothetical protein B7Z15_10340 [Rhizobiales bacterium 32-66-8]
MPSASAYSRDPAMTERTVRVDLAGRPYDIVIGPGLLSGIGARIAELRPGARVAIVTDAHVADVHLPTVEAALAQAGIESSAVVVAPGEKTKSYAGLQQVAEGLISARIEGTFHQPVLVVADTAALDTLPAREVRAGYAEVAKYGLLGDEALFGWLEAHGREVIAGGPARGAAVAASCLAKAAIVARDEKETGDRALLNLGHTFGHALEAGAGFSDRLLHGEAVAIGMSLAFAYSARLGLCSGQDAVRAVRHLEAVGLPTRIADVPGPLPDTDGLMTLIAQDKKVSRGALTFILAHGIGRAFIAKDVDPASVREFLAQMRTA